jgi:trans-aconitate methyltransferase
MYAFDGEKYKSASRHQKEWGWDLIAGLALKGNESILDLGCGDGVLTEQLSLLVPNGRVIGIDASASMISTAQTLHRENLEFVHMDINEIPFEHEFDLIFSNAALHWVKDHKRLLRNSYRALRPGGELLWDFGGFGNCSNFCDVIQKKIKEPRYMNYFANFQWPWFMPSKSQYTELIAELDFPDYAVKEINRDRYFSNASEMVQWIDQPCIVPFTEHLPYRIKADFRREVVEEMLRRTRQPDGTCFETFRRLMVYARKPNVHTDRSA